MKLSLFNTVTRKREDFEAIDDNLVKMYVCGPTVYDHPHIGNARSVVVYDILFRTLIHLYGKDKVLYVRNITDIDDKIMERAASLSVPISELTHKTTIDFHEDMEYLGCLPPNKEPKATEHVDDMIDIIQRLLVLNIAYQSADHVYFDVSKAPNYTELSSRSLDELYASVRIDSDENKKNSADFVLWKPANDGDAFGAKFASPFGQGRPGWHIECSAMSNRFLGENFDIHGGGIDLIFPHHTNEIAQSCCAFPGSAYAKYWVHNGFLTVNHEKMSKSLGNFVTVKDLRDKNIKGDVARLLLLSVHYRKPLDYNEKAVHDAQKMLNYWYRAITSLRGVHSTTWQSQEAGGGVVSYGITMPHMEARNDDSVKTPLPQEFLEALLDDLNTHMAVKLINDFAKEVHESGDTNAARKMLICAQFLGLMRQTSIEWFKGDIDDARINELISQRTKAKKEKNWQEADQIREKLTSMGIAIEDKPDGSTEWYQGRNG